MKTSTTTPRTSRKTPSTAAKAAPAAKAVKQAAAPRVRRAAPKKTKSPAGVEAATPALSPEAVRFRAYEIYLNRNGQGDQLSDWLQAEQELVAHAG
jgi:hypothetical protein